MSQLVYPSDCVKCKNKLQAKVDFCPFCGEDIKGYMNAQQKAGDIAKRQADADKQAEADRKKAEEEARAEKVRQADLVKQAEEARIKAEEEKIQADKQEATRQIELTQQAEADRVKAINEAKTDQPSSNKFAVIAGVVVVLLIVYVLMPDSKNNTTLSEGNTASVQAASCDTIIGEINAQLGAARPSRALNIVKIHQNDCKNESQFVESAFHAENKVNAAKEKLGLAKEYAQKENFDMASLAAQGALDIDSDIVGANELLQEIKELQERKENAEAEQVVESQNATAADVWTLNEPEPQPVVRNEPSFVIPKVANPEQPNANVNKQSIAKMLNHAESSLKQGKYETAAKTAENILLFDPSNKRAREILEISNRQPTW